jgi:hypothetical protein
MFALNSFDNSINIMSKKVTLKQGIAISGITFGVAALVAAAIAVTIIFTVKAKKNTASGSNVTFQMKHAAAENTTYLTRRLTFVKKPLKNRRAVVQGNGRRTLLEQVSPTFFGMKFVSAYLTEDVDPDTQNNIGSTQMIYLNPQCLDDIGKCGVNPSEDTNLITSYFDFTKTTDEVNSQLNAQARGVEQNTYRFVRLEFCKNGTGGNPNIAFKAGDMEENHEFALPMCAVTAEISPPLVVTDTTNVVLSLSYDLTDLVSIFDTYPGSENCTNTAPSYCLNVPDFVPSADSL